jgi:transposase InsO family protein
LISSSNRQEALELINEARKAGARLAPCCKIMNLSTRTYERWVKEEGIHDRRSEARRQAPHNKLTEGEQQEILNTCNSKKFADLNPSQIVPKLADDGRYIASESTFYRVLKAYKQNTNRKAQRTHGHRPLATHVAQAPNQVWTWDITWIPGAIKGCYYKLYLILDIFSRMIIQWEIHESETQVHAMELVKKAVFRHNVLHKPLVLHSDNGSPMKGQDFQNLLAHLGITKSYSRPRVSNDNAFSESLFKTLKYTKDFPNSGFESIESARSWINRFVDLYNKDFMHSAIKFVTPYQRHYGFDQEVLEKRKAVYEKARQENPGRWSGKIRNWDYIEYVALNPVHKEEVLSKTRQLT